MIVKAVLNLSPASAYFMLVRKSKEHDEMRRCIARMVRASLSDSSSPSPISFESCDVRKPTEQPALVSDDQPLGIAITPGRTAAARTSTVAPKPQLASK